jgi:hypothetical protein
MGLERPANPGTAGKCSPRRPADLPMGINKVRRPKGTHRGPPKMA